MSYYLNQDSKLKHYLRYINWHCYSNFIITTEAISLSYQVSSPKLWLSKISQPNVLYATLLYIYILNVRITPKQFRLIIHVDIVIVTCSTILSLKRNEIPLSYCLTYIYIHECYSFMFLQKKIMCSYFNDFL